MKKFIPLTTWALCSATAVIFAGCARNSQSAAAIEAPGNSPSTPAGSTSGRGSAIARREGVPNGIATPSGLTVPKGFEVNVFAEGLSNPRRLAIAPGATPGKYDVFVAESKVNRIRVLRENNGDGKADEKFVFTEKVEQPYGIAFHASGWVYIGDTDRVVRFPYQAGATASAAEPQEITRLTAGGYNQHWTRNVLFSRDGKKLYVTVGSSCNTCEEGDPQRAAISVMNPDGSGRKLFASGLRNPVGMAWSENNDLWTVVNERDRLGDDSPPDYLTRVQDGGFYGWPYAYVNLNRSISPDPNFGDKQPEKVKKMLPATVPVQAHSAALGVAFYPNLEPFKMYLNPGPEAFPKEYSNDAFLAFHGSWNRSERTGYKIVRVDFQKGKAVSITDFVTGFLKDGRVSGRPVDVQIAPDGSLLFSDDDGGKIWRVSRAK